MCYEFYQSLEPNTWTTYIENRYWSNFLYQTKTAPEFDARYICLSNGNFRLKDNKLVKHSYKRFTMPQVNIKYDANAECPLFEKFLHDVTGGDSSLVMLLQEVMGYACLSRVTTAEKMFILSGDGANGKSVLLDILTALAGKENVSTVSFKGFSEKFSLCQIVGKQLNIAPENEASQPLNTATLKATISGDSLQIQFKGKDSFSYKPTVKLVFATNNLPYTADKSFGFERRAVVIPFNQCFLDNPNPKNPRHHKADKDLRHKLLKELSGIFNFALAGLARLIDNNYQFTESVQATSALGEYQLDMNPHLAFCRECVKEIEGATIESGKIVTYFKRWCDSNGHGKLANQSTRMILKNFRSILDKENISFGERKSNGKILFDSIQVSVPSTRSNSSTQGIDDLLTEEE